MYDHDPADIKGPYRIGLGNIRWRVDSGAIPRCFVGLMSPRSPRGILRIPRPDCICSPSSVFSARPGLRSRLTYPEFLHGETSRSRLKTRRRSERTAAPPSTDPNDLHPNLAVKYWYCFPKIMMLFVKAVYYYSNLCLTFVLRLICLWNQATTALRQLNQL